jgi:hypothetical protein
MPGALPGRLSSLAPEVKSAPEFDVVRLRKRLNQVRGVSLIDDGLRLDSVAFAALAKRFRKPRKVTPARDVVGIGIFPQLYDV